MRLEILTKSLWDQRRALLGWAIGVAVVALVYGSFYPFVQTTAMDELVTGMPQGLLDAMGWNDIASPAGYIGSTVFGLVGPVVVLVFAIAVGTRALAGDEEAGTLELVATHPVTRTRIVLERAGAVVLAMGMTGSVAFATMLAIRGPAEIDIPVGHLAAASLQLALLGVCFGMLAIAIGGFVGRRGFVIGAAATVAAGTYIGNAVFPLVEQLEWAQKFTPFYFYSGGEPLKNGLDIGHFLVLAAISGVLLAVAVVSFNRRDIGTS
jgi:ABC-2 type transport system permease protein